MKTSAAPFTIIGVSVAADLRRYKCVWRNYREDALNLGIDGDCVLWRVQDISLPDTTSFVVIHCSTNNINQNQPNDIAGGILNVTTGQDVLLLVNNNQ